MKGCWISARQDAWEATPLQFRIQCTHLRKFNINYDIQIPKHIEHRIL